VEIAKAFLPCSLSWSSPTLFEFDEKRIKQKTAKIVITFKFLLNQ